MSDFDMDHEDIADEEDEEQESLYVELLRERYTPPDDASYEENADFLYLLNAPEQYGAEGPMYAHMKYHPDATMKELIDFLDSLFPDGVPEEFMSLDDDDDEDDF